MAVIPELRRQRQEDGKIGESGASLGCHKLVPVPKQSELSSQEHFI